MNRKPGLAVGRSWPLSLNGPRKCDRSKGAQLFDLTETGMEGRESSQFNQLLKRLLYD